ncbi:hypothetical protein FDZ84_22845 [Saccharopolyspora sp. ASAGF58]|nr:hypothetical protein FDZ84_22845 [Saccharopolyspora sp. ASAGF58]
MRAVDGLNRLSSTLRGQTDEIAGALDGLGPGSPKGDGGDAGALPGRQRCRRASPVLQRSAMGATFGWRTGPHHVRLTGWRVPEHHQRTPATQGDPARRSPRRWCPFRNGAAAARRWRARRPRR